MRSPAGTGSCCFMISLTLETAVVVRLTGFLGVVSTLGVVVEAIQISFKFGCSESRPLIWVLGIKTIIVQIPQTYHFDAAQELRVAGEDLRYMQKNLQNACKTGTIIQFEVPHTRPRVVCGVV